MTVIHHVAAPGVTLAPAARQGQQMGGPEGEVEGEVAPALMPPDAPAVADQAGRFW